MKIFLSFLLLLSLLALSGCGQSVASVQAGLESDSVIIAMETSSEPVAGFDPAYGWGAGEHPHSPLIQSTLTVTTDKLLIANDLAADISVSDDGLLWTVKIRSGVFFTDGEPLTAHDVAFTYNKVKEESPLNDFTMLEQAEAADDTTVEFHMNRAYALWPYSMALVGIMPEHAYSPSYGQSPIGSGPYILKQWDRGQQLILEANPDYYGAAPIMKKVTVLFMDETAALAAIQSGQIDMAYTSAMYSEQGAPGYKLLNFESVDNRGFNLPVTDGSITGDLSLRKALNIGLDRAQMIENVLNGYGTPAYSVCDKTPWFNEEATVEFNFEQAVSILEQGGWIAGSDGIRVKNNLRAEFHLLYPVGDSVRQALAAETAAQMKNLGIAAEIEGVGWDTAYERALSEPLLWGWGAHTPIELYNLYHTSAGGSAKYSPYANERVDAYMDQALAADSLEASYELWKKAQWDGTAGILGDLPWIWLVNIDHLYWARDGLQVTPQKIHPHGHGWSLLDNVDKWKWEIQ